MKMAKKHPCLECHIHIAGKSKDNPECKRCEDRWLYAKFEEREKTPCPVVTQSEEGLMIQHKTCATCGEKKPVTSFSRNVRSKDGLLHSCKACLSAKIKNKRTSPLPQSATRQLPVSIHFDEYRDMFADLQRNADSNFRTIEQQILFIIALHLKSLEA